MYRREQGKAMFMLKRQFEHLHIAQVPISVGSLSADSVDKPDDDDISSGIMEGPGLEDDDEVIEAADLPADEASRCDDKPETGN